MVLKFGESGMQHTAGVIGGDRHRTHARPVSIATGPEQHLVGIIHYVCDGGVKEEFPAMFVLCTSQAFQPR